MLNSTQTYHRKKQILYDESGNQIVKFIGITADADNLIGDLVDNMNKYIECYPDRIEVLEKKENVQLNLF